MKKQITILTTTLILIIMSIATTAQYTQTSPFRYTTSLSIPPLTCKMVQPIRESPTCYQDGLAECARINTFICFTQCANYVRNSCFDIQSTMPTCTLHQDFFRHHTSRQECNKAVIQACKERCLTEDLSYNYKIGYNAERRCVEHGRIQCSRIKTTHTILR